MSPTADGRALELAESPFFFRDHERLVIFFLRDHERTGQCPLAMSPHPRSRSGARPALGALAGLALVAALAVAVLHQRDVGRAVLDAQAAGPKSAAASLTVYDSSVGRGVLEAERDVDALFVQLSQAQTRLNHLTNKVLEAGHQASPSKPGAKLHQAEGTKLHQSAHAVHVQEALDRSIAEAKANVDRLSHALRDAEEKLNTRVSFIVDAHAADRKTAAGTSSKDAAAASQLHAAPGGKSPAEGPPVALAHMARASQLAEQAPVAASGDKPGFPSHAAERRSVRSAYRKFFQLKAAKQAKAAKEASEGWDVTPYSDCKGKSCDVQVYLNLQTPTVDYTARTGKHFLPSLKKLRQTVRERGRLSLEDARQAVQPQGKKPAYQFEWQRPGAKRVAIGGVADHGKRCGYGPGLGRDRICVCASVPLGRRRRNAALVFGLFCPA